jgi:hypothetical protein
LGNICQDVGTDYAIIHQPKGILQSDGRAGIAFRCIGLKGRGEKAHCISQLLGCYPQPVQVGRLQVGQATSPSPHLGLAPIKGTASKGNQGLTPRLRTSFGKSSQSLVELGKARVAQHGTRSGHPPADKLPADPQDVRRGIGRRTADRRRLSRGHHRAVAEGDRTIVQ